MEEMYNRLRAAHQQSQRGDDLQRKKRGRQTLEQNVSKRMTTVMIGAISKMEAFLGHLWGHNKPESERTEAELDAFDAWQQCRDEILNAGNSQKRMLISELDLFDIYVKGFNKVLTQKEPKL